MFTKSPISGWRQHKQNYLLQGNKCLKCKKIHYPKAYLCPCESKQFETTKLTGKGTLLSFTQIVIPPKIFSKYAPYCIGIIQLEQGPKIVAQIADTQLQDLKIGMKMKACFRKIYSDGNDGIINYGLKFIPIEIF